VRIAIEDATVRILTAGELWGLATIDALDALTGGRNRDCRALAIGPAGERLSRIATIHTATSSACGQGGFGAVMGAKRLKAISVAGSGSVPIADPERVRAIARAIVRAFAEDGASGPLNYYGDMAAYRRALQAEGSGSAVCHACTEGCITPCVAHIQDMPGHVHNRTWSADWMCVGTRFAGFDPTDPSHLRRIYAWQLPRRAAFEMSVLSNRHGFSQADLIGGIVPWLIACQREGLIAELNGRPIDWDSPRFWAQLLDDIACRRGIGDALADGGWAAAHALRLGQDLAAQRYPGWGHSSHCDGREGGELPFPFWIVSALQWLADTRDPFGSGHGYLWTVGASARAAAQATEGERQAELARICALGERVYGGPDAVDPRSGYGGKAYPGYYQTVRAVIKDCLPADAHFPLIYRESAPDRYWRLEDVDGGGTIEGPSIEYHLFAAVSGLGWSEQEFWRAAERVCTLERALQVRYWARDRTMDGLALPYFCRTELHQSAFHSRRYVLDRERFRPVQDAFYALHGWDAQRGWPTQERMATLGLGDLYGPMVAGARRARERNAVP
jgi:hypothetical protein